MNGTQRRLPYLIKMLQEYLVKLIHLNFDFLFKEFDFKKFTIRETQRVIYFHYKKEDFLVRIQYSLSNHYIGIDFFKEVNENRLRHADTISLAHILKDKKKDYNYEKDYGSV